MIGRGRALRSRFLQGENLPANLIALKEFADIELQVDEEEEEKLRTEWDFDQDLI